MSIVNLLIGDNNVLSKREQAQLLVVIAVLCAASFVLGAVIF